MRRARGYFVPFVAVAAVALPAWAICPFSSPIVHGGDFQGAIPGSILSIAIAVGGTWWEVGHGDPVVGVGNDSGSVSDAGLPATDRIWIARDRRGTSGIAITYDWTNPGVDNCLSSTVAGSGRMAAFLVDSSGDYALVGVQGKSSPVGHHDFDDVQTGQGPFGNDIPMVPLSLVPRGTVHLETLTDTTIVADFLPARASINCHDDGSGVCDDPSLLHVLATQILVDGSPLPGCDADGCTGVTVPRGPDICWDQGAQIAGNIVPGASACSIAPLSCTSDDDCATFGLGTCVTGPPTVHQMGPTISAGCVLVARTTLADVARDARSQRAGGGTGFSWVAASFETSHFNIVGTTRGREVLNDAPIFARSSDGIEQEYQVTIPSRRVRFHRSFVIQAVRNDGSVAETAVD